MTNGSLTLNGVTDQELISLLQAKQQSHNFTLQSLQLLNPGFPGPGMPGFPPPGMPGAPGMPGGPGAPGQPPQQVYSVTLAYNTDDGLQVLSGLIQTLIQEDRQNPGIR